MKNIFPRRLKGTLNTHLRPHQVGPPGRLGPLWLALGTMLSLFAANGRWDLSLAAWLAPLFFLRFTRSSKPLIGFAFVWLASLGSLFFFFYQSEMPLQSPLLIAGSLVINTVLVLPYLIDRLVSPRLGLISGLLAILIFPLSRVTFEFLNTLLISPFGSIFSLAYTQYGNLPLLQIMSITGIYGVSFLIAWFASVANWTWEQGFAWPRIRRITLLYSGLLALVLLGGSIRLTFFPASAQLVRVAGMSIARSTLQNVSQTLSNFRRQKEIGNGDRGAVRSIFTSISEELLARSQQEARAGAKIIVWPEAGVFTLEEDEANLIERGKTLAHQENIYLEMGFVVLRQMTAYQDRAVLIDPAGRVIWTYDKAHPVPGLESFVPGEGNVPVVDTPYGRLANVICFDADFPDLMRQAGGKGVDIMLVPSNDWRGIDPWHTHNATFRAIENGFSLVRQASRGQAMTVDYQGHVLAATDYFTTDQQTMIAYVPVKGVGTIYARAGDLFAWLCLTGLLLLAGFVAFASLQRCVHFSALAGEPSSVSTEDGHKSVTLMR